MAGVTGTASGPSGPGPTPAARRPLRRDAERNLRRILAAAGELVAERGLGVSHDEVARAADVAVGTVYRRFPTKEALVEALFTDRVHEVVALARGALDVADPWRALEEFLTRTVELQAADRGLRELTSASGRGTALARYSREQIAPITAELVARAHAAGVLRPDVAQPDIALVPLMVGGVIDAARTVDPDLWRRALAVVLDGLRAGHPAPLPGRPLTPGQFDELLGGPPAPGR